MSEKDFEKAHNEFQKELQNEFHKEFLNAFL